MTAALFNGTHGVAAVAIIATVVSLGLILAFRVAQGGNPKPRRTRVGVFVERDRYQDEPSADEAQTRTWPRRDDQAELDPGDY